MRKSYSIRILLGALTVLMISATSMKNEHYQKAYMNTFSRNRLAMEELKLSY